MRVEHKLRAFQNGVLRKIGLKGDKVMGEYSKLHGVLNDLYCLPNFVRVSKSGKMRWAGHVARIQGFGGEI
jgi:hypothetical protein